MDKIILVFNVGVEPTASTDQRIHILNTVKNQATMLLRNEKDIILFVVPSIGDVSIKIDCVNPKLVNETEYSSIKDRLEKIEAGMTEFIKTNTAAGPKID